jgi:hypothetical protein
VSDTDAEVLRRHFVAIATSDYDDPKHRPLPGVVEEVNALRNWLCDSHLGSRSFTHSFPELSSNPTKRQLRDALETPERPWTHSDAAVVYVTGHGMRADGTHWVVLKTTDPARPPSTAQRTSEVIGWLKDTNIEHLMIVLDLCYSGAAVADTVSFDFDLPATWIPLASVTSNQKAHVGALTTVIADFLEELASPIGRKYDHGPFLRVDEFISAIQDGLAKKGQRLANLHHSYPSLATDSPCLPNPRYNPGLVTVRPARRDLALRQGDLEAHWDPRSRGVATGADSGWLFSGRTALMNRLIQAATTGTAPVLVTGAAGTGKSAVIARLVTLSDPDFCARYAALVDAIAPDLRPPLGVIDAAVLATGKVPHEVLAQIYEAIIGDRPTGSSAVPSLDELRNAWWAWLGTHDRAVTIVVDALDEADNPHKLLTEVLAQLTPPGQPGRVRLIVGVRSPGGVDDATTDNVGAGHRPLADIAEQTLHATRLRIDETPWWQALDLADYAYELLTRTDTSPYAAPEHHAGAHAVADALAEQAGKSFLIARIAATSLADRADRVDPQDPAWRATLADGVLGVFRDDLHATLPDPGDRQRAVHLLRAVAFAYGRGLPWRQVWPLVANAVADDPDRSYGDGDIAWLLTSRLGGYLVTDQEDGITVYRLFHDTLRSTLRERSEDLLHTDKP